MHLSQFSCRFGGLLLAIGAATFLTSCQTVNPAAAAFARGGKLQEAGLLADAKIVYREAIQHDPKFAPPYRALAEMANRTGDMSTAITCWNDYIKRDPDAKHTWCHLAETEMKASLEVPALEHAEQELKRDPECPLANLIVGLLYVKKSNMGKALPPLEKAACAFPLQSRVQLTYGHVLAQAEQYDAADKVLTPLVNAEKSRPDPFYWLGYVYARRSTDSASAAKAETLLRHALALNADYEPAVFELGRLYMTQHRPAEALPLLKQAVTESRFDPAPAYALAQTYTQLGHATDSAIALEDFKKRSDLAMKRKKLLRQLAIAPRDAELNHAFGMQEIERGDIRSALLFLEAAHSLAPQSEAITRDLESVRQKSSNVPDIDVASAIPEIPAESHRQ